MKRFKISLSDIRNLPTCPNELFNMLPNRKYIDIFNVLEQTKTPTIFFNWLSKNCYKLQNKDVLEYYIYHFEPTTDNLKQLFNDCYFLQKPEIEELINKQTNKKEYFDRRTKSLVTVYKD